VLTYHAFAARIIADHGLRFGIEPTATLLGEGPARQLAYEVVCESQLPLGLVDLSPGKLAEALIDLDQSLADLAVDTKELLEYDRKAITWLQAFPDLSSAGQTLLRTSRRRQVLSELVVQWRQVKKERGVLDHADQTRIALELVTKYPAICETLRPMFDLVMLDEYQDTSVAQRRILQQIFGLGHGFTAVGDPCQSLYTWRGASLDTIDSFLTHFTEPHLKDQAPNLALTSNRRSDLAILSAANATSAPLRERHPNIVELVPGDATRPVGELTCALFDTVVQERAWICERIGELGRANPWQSIAVLGATGAILADVAVQLERGGIPVQLHGAAGLLHQPAVADLYATLRAVHDPTDNVALARLLTGVRWAIGPRDLAALGRRARELAQSGGRPKTSNVYEALDAAVAGSDPVEALALGDALADPGDAQQYSVPAYERFVELGAELRNLRRAAGQPLGAFVSRVIAVTNLAVEAALDTHEAGHVIALRAFLKLVDDCGVTSLGGLLRLLADIERFDVDLPMEDLPAANAVQLMTIHKAKGLEFPHVFVPAVAAGVFPSGKARTTWVADPAKVPYRLRDDKPRDLEDFPLGEECPRPKDLKAYLAALKELDELDDRRLAYVAFTRARHSLMVTGYRWGMTQIKPYAESPYLQAVAAACGQGVGTVLQWAPAPADDATNPLLEQGPRRTHWPVAIGQRQAVVQAADAVRQWQQRPDVLPGMPVTDLESRLTDSERAYVASWDSDAAAFLAEARRSRERQRRVRLPDSLSASVLLRALREPEVLAQDLARPMPQRPSPAASRGVAFHSWAEQRFGQQTLLVPDDVPGAADAELIDVDLLELQRAFESSAFANRVPVAIEHPFALVVGGRVIRGRIDAVFELNGRYDVIDWKTGTSADPMQLAIYATAWALERGVAVDQVDAGFLMVRTGEIIRPTPLPDLAAALLR
jgi:DNA helicase-2/ATP-dependent DNA helicase PcrA